MKTLGIWLVGLGVLVALGALAMATSVSTETPIGLYGRTTVSEVYNLGLLQRQMMIFVTGLAIAIAGVVLAVAGAGIDTTGTVATPAPEGSSETAPAAAKVFEAVAVQQQLTPGELAERDRDVNRATFIFAAGILAVVGAVFLIAWLAS